MKPWVADASPLLFLAKIDRLPLLRDQAPEVLVPQAVFTEVSRRVDPAAAAIKEAAESWLQVAQVGNRRAVDLIRTSLGAGESEVIALARECQASRVAMYALEEPAGSLTGSAWPPAPSCCYQILPTLRLAKFHIAHLTGDLNRA